MEILKGKYKGVEYKYSPHTQEDDSNGILIINCVGVESTHIIKNWGITRVFQYIASFENVV